MNNNQDIKDPSKLGVKGLKGVNTQTNEDTAVLKQFSTAADYFSQPVEKRRIQETLGTPFKTYVGTPEIGQSIYDYDITSRTQLEDLQDTRGELQPWYAQIGAGIAKGAVLAGTTFLDGTIGLLTGTASALSKGDVSQLWQNDFSKTMKDVNDWAEQVMPNYYTNAEREEPWYNNIFTANFLGDKFIKNLGFTVGAFYSGNVASMGLKAAGLSNLVSKITSIAEAPAMVATGVGASISALNEGRIEALNNSTDWFNLQKARIDDEFTKHIQDIYLTQKEGPGRDLLVQQVTEAYDATMGKLSEDKAKMGNMDMLLNLPILLASNVVQFGKLYANGYKTARKVDNILTRAGGEYATTSSTARGITKALLNPLAEGTEEISQKAVSTISGDYYQDDMDNFLSSKIDPKAEQKTLSWIKSFGQGINETVNDSSSWEEFTIGAITGAMGMPMFRSAKKQGGGFQSPVTLEGGIAGEFKEYREEMGREQEIVNYLNNRVNSPEFKNYYQGMIRHNKLQNMMDASLSNDDEFNYKNAETSQMISDIMMFDNAGKIGDLHVLINAADDTSDANLEAIIKNTTTQTTDASGKEVNIGPFIDVNGNAMTDTEEGKKQMIDKINKNKKDIVDTINAYRKVKDSIDTAGGEVFSDDQLEELTFLGVKMQDFEKRSEDLGATSKIYLDKIKAGVNSRLEVLNTENSIKDVETSPEVEELTKTKNLLEMLTSMSAKGLALTTTSSAQNRKLIQNTIDYADQNNLLDSIETSTFTKTLQDLGKVEKARNEYSEKFNAYRNDPKLSSEAYEEKKVALRKTEASKYVDAMGSITSNNDLKQKLEDVPEVYRQDVMDILQTSENPDIRQAFNNLRDVDEFIETINNIGDTLGTDGIEAVNTINEVMQNSNNVPEAIDNLRTKYEDILSADENNQEAISGLQILDKYENLKNVKQTTSPDENKSEHKTESYREDEVRSTSDFSSFGAFSEAIKNAKTEVKSEESTTEEPETSTIKELDSGDISSTNEDTSFKSDSNTNSDAGKSFKSWIVTKYFIGKGVDKIMQKLHLKDEPELMKIQEKLDRLAAYDFVDYGNLGKLLKEDPNLTIHYIYDNDSNSVTHQQILLGVIMTSKEKEIINKLYYNPLSIEGNEFQVVGILGYNDNIEMASLAKNSVAHDNYNTVRDVIAEEFRDVKGKYLVSNKYYNKVKKVRTGRISKGENTRTVDSTFLEKRDLHLGFYYDNNDFRTPTLASNETITPLNTYNTAPREGSVWLMSQEADGNWYPKSLNVKRFNTSEINLAKEENNPIIKELTSQLEIISNPNTSDKQKMDARDTIENLLYFPSSKEEKHTIVFKTIEDINNPGTAKTSVSFKDMNRGVDINDIAGDFLDPKKKAIHLLQELQGLNLRFQVSPTLLLENKTRYTKMLLDSGILTTDLTRMNNFNASFEMYLNGPDGKPVIDTVDRSRTSAVKKDLDISPPKRVYLNNKEFRKYPDGKITNTDGVIITDIKELAEIDLMDRIINDKAESIGLDMYEGTYTDGTKFGIRNGKVVSQYEYNSTLAKIKAQKAAEVLKHQVDEVIPDAMNDAVTDSIPTEISAESSDIIKEAQTLTNSTKPLGMLESAGLLANAIQEQMDSEVSRTIDKAIETKRTIDDYIEEDEDSAADEFAPEGNYTGTINNETPINLTNYIIEYTDSQLIKDLKTKYNISDIKELINKLESMQDGVLLDSKDRINEFLENLLHCR